MSEATVWKRVTFDAAHHLPNYKGACHRVHGHTYTVELGLQGEVSTITGMVVDMSKLSSFLKSTIIKWYDHCDLNKFFENPTAENIALYLLGVAQTCFKYDQPSNIFVRVYETPTSWAEVECAK